MSITAPRSSRGDCRGRHSGSGANSSEMPLPGFILTAHSPAARGKLGSDERIYLFISSSMPLQTVRNYAASVARLGDPGIVLVMRGFIEGMTKIQPTIRFIGTVLQRDPSCNPPEGECEMLPAALVSRSPAVSAVRHRPGSRSRLCPRSQGGRCGSE